MVEQSSLRRFSVSVLRLLSVTTRHRVVCGVQWCKVSVHIHYNYNYTVTDNSLRPSTERCDIPSGCEDMTDSGETRALVEYHPEGSLAATRVMSPSPRFYEGTLQGVRAACQLCQMVVNDPTVCAGCGKYGHHQCLGLEDFHGYQFCIRCLPQVKSQYAAFLDSQRQEDWQRTLSGQLTSWRSRAIDAIGATSTLGVTVGGVVATAAGAAAGLAQGAVRGVVQVASASRSSGSGPTTSVPELVDATPAPPE